MPTYLYDLRVLEDNTRDLALRVPDADAPAAPGSRTEWVLTAVVALLGVMPVASLLAWIYRLGPMWVWFITLSVPSGIAIAVIAFVIGRRDIFPRLRTALVIGFIGGVIATFGYDVVRVPQQLFGFRPFFTIQSYGLLILDTPSSSPLTEFIGWAYNVSNGVGFAITYAVVAWRRPWWWGVLWAFTLESSTVVSPFVQWYGLAGHWDSIGLAYFSHIFYGVPLGLMVQHGPRVAGLVQAAGRHVAKTLLAVVALSLVVWQQPWSLPDDLAAGRSVSPGRPSAVIRNGRFAPQWMRIAPGACAIVRNDDRTPYPLDGADGNPSIAPGQTQSICSSTLGMVRVRTSTKADAGGLLLVDWAAGTR